jgi:hypothetical protein
MPVQLLTSTDPRIPDESRRVAQPKLYRAVSYPALFAALKARRLLAVHAGVFFSCLRSCLTRVFAAISIREETTCPRNQREIVVRLTPRSRARRAD